LGGCSPYGHNYDLIDEDIRRREYDTSQEHKPGHITKEAPYRSPIEFKK
jgi:hypothetical protein